MHTVKLFTNGGSQAVRLPKKYRFASKEVYIQPVKGEVLLPGTSPSWKPLLESLESISEDFPNKRVQPKYQHRGKF
jgi:antitoxin VapB